jgi:uncharacterized protein (DUF849 family)
MIIEARINEYAMRDDNPHVPWTPDEIAETAARCYAEGASIIHFHARNADGSPLHGAAAYGEIIRKIRARCDVLVHPTLGWFSNDGDPAGRIDAITALAADPATRPDIAPIDTGSTNLELFDAASGAFTHADRVYRNQTDTLLHYARELRRVGVKPNVVCWSVGFQRRAMAMLQAGELSGPLWMLMNMTDGPYLTGHPGTEIGLEAHLKFLPREAPIEWASNIVGGNLIDLVEMSAMRGGHVAPGIGDYPYVELGSPPNELIIRRAVAIARAAGREIASVAETRDLLGLPTT